MGVSRARVPRDSSLSHGANLWPRYTECRGRPPRDSFSTNPLKVPNVFSQWSSRVSRLRVYDRESSGKPKVKTCFNCPKSKSQLDPAEILEIYCPRLERAALAEARRALPPRL